MDDDVPEDVGVAGIDEVGEGLEPNESVGLTVAPEDPVDVEVPVDAALAVDVTVLEPVVVKDADCVDVELEVVVGVWVIVCDWDAVLDEVDDGLLLGAAAVP